MAIPVEAERGVGVSVDDRFTRQYCNFGAMNEVYARFFNGQMPARVCYQVAALPKGAKVEIDVIAVK